MKPWNVIDDDIVRQHKPKEAAAMTGRSIDSIFTRRRVLGIADGNTRMKRMNDLRGNRFGRLVVKHALAESCSIPLLNPQRCTQEN